MRVDKDPECEQFTTAQFRLVEFPWRLIDFNISQGNTFIRGQVAAAILFFFFNFFGFIYLLIYLWLCWVFVSVRGLSLVAASGGHSSSWCAGLSLSRPLLLRSTGSRRAGSVIVAHGPCCSAACGIFPDQGLNPCPLHWQADSQPLRHQGSPTAAILTVKSRGAHFLCHVVHSSINFFVGK